MYDLITLGKNAKAAADKLAVYSPEQKNKGLAACARALTDRAKELLSANRQDIENAEKNGVSPAMIDRLRLTEERIRGMAEGLDQITELSERNKDLTSNIKEATASESDQLQEMTSLFEVMLGLLRETEEGNQQIVTLVESLNTDKDTIMNSVESLSSVSEENAASTEETSASLTQLDTNMETVVEHAESLQRIAEELRENVSIFKIDGQA